MPPEFELSEGMEALVNKMIGKRQDYDAAVREIHRVQFMKNCGEDRTNLSIEGIAIVLRNAGFDTLGDHENQAEIQRKREEDAAYEDEQAKAEQEAARKERVVAKT